MSFISNSSYLAGRSHPLMRESILGNFHEAWIDNMNGDKYRTGKIVPDDIPGAGTSDQSVFTTDEDPRGIQVGVSISTFLKRKKRATAPADTLIHYRDFWGRADKKRGALLTSLEMESWGDSERNAAAALPEGPRAYESFQPTEDARWRFTPGTSSAGYESWPALDQVFPVQFQGVNPNRGLTDSLIDVNVKALAERMRRYFEATSFDEVKKAAPELAKNRARYDAEALWRELKGRAAFVPSQAVPYLLFPLDSRWVYYEPSSKLLNERRPEFWDNLANNEFLIAVPQPRRVSESRPVNRPGLSGDSFS